VDAVSLEGEPTRVVFAQSVRYGWHLSVGVPQAELAAGIYRTVLLFGVIALVLLIGGAALALRIGRALSRAITSLAPAVHSLGRGEPVVRRETGVPEVDRVGSALAQASAALRASEAALVRAKEEAERANRAKTQFLAAASHDLRQPVQALFLFQDILAGRLQDHPCQPIVAHMHTGLSALKSLLDGLLDLSRLQAGIVGIETAAFPIALLLDRLQAEYGGLARAEGIRLRVVGSTAWVHSDMTLLERILRHLLDNACKFTGSGGTVLLGCRRSGDRLRIEVADSGFGIPPDQLDAVFEEFVQLGNPERDRTKGLGLGLAIVRRLAELLGHAVKVRSRLGRGTAFSVVVPVVSSPSERAVPARASLPASGGLALVVDDEPLALAGLRSMLESWGWEVLTAADGDAAVRRLRADGRTPDVVVADDRLRGEETGLQVIGEVHRVCRRSIAAVVLTGESNPEAITGCTRPGVRLVPKPADPAALHGILAAIDGR
jgi:signal transduction histidine kinase/CheY-like chemotaxis protein